MLDGLSKIFKHLGRDVMIYMMPGLVVLLDLAYLDYLYDTQVYVTIQAIPCSYSWIVFVGLLYIFGTISMAFAEVLYPKIDKWEPYAGLLNDDIAVAKKDMGLYDQFVERYNTLSLYRYNLRYSFLLCAVLNVIFGLIYGLIYSFRDWLLVVLIITALLLILFWIFRRLCCQTDCDYYDRVRKIAQQ